MHHIYDGTHYLFFLSPEVTPISFCCEGNSFLFLAFGDCEKLTNAVFNSVIVADDYSFYSCGRITYIQFGSGTTTIGQYALWNPYQGGPSTTLNMQVSAVPNTASNALPEYDIETYQSL